MKKEKNEAEFESMVDMETLAALTNMSVEFIKKAKSKMNLPHYKVGASVRFRLSEVNQWLRERHNSKSAG